MKFCCIWFRFRPVKSTINSQLLCDILLRGFTHQGEFFLLIFFLIFWPFIHSTWNKQCLETWSYVCGHCPYGLLALKYSPSPTKADSELSLKAVTHNTCYGWARTTVYRCRCLLVLHWCYIKLRYCTGTGDNYDVMAAQKLNDSTVDKELILLIMNKCNQ